MSVAEVPVETSSEATAEETAKIFAAAFDVPHVDVDDDFFQLGGDSLIGQSLLAAIEQRWAVSLSLSVLLQASTPRTLTATVTQANAAQSVRCLIPINGQGTPPAIFYVHGTDGESVAPARLSAGLPARSFYAFRALGLEQGEPFLRTADAIAGRYLAEIESAYAGVPGIILGHCAGAAIAYEIAQQMTAAGRPPRGLILLDPEVGKEGAPFLYGTGLALSLMRGIWKERAVKLDAFIAAHPNPDAAARRTIVRDGLQHAAAMYTPRPYAGSTLLISTPERKADLMNSRYGYPVLLKNLTFCELGVKHIQMFDEGLPAVLNAVEAFVARVGSAA